jgi:ribosomal protein S18
MSTVLLKPKESFSKDSSKKPNEVNRFSLEAKKKENRFGNEKEKRSFDPGKKNRGYWKQRYKPHAETASGNSSLHANEQKARKFKKSLKYVLFLQKFSKLSKGIDYKNIKLLKLFLTKHGKIKSRRKTRISLAHQRKLGKAIRKARVCGLLPFTCLVKDIRKEKKRDKRISKKK